MKLAKAKQIIKDHKEGAEYGFRVHFETYSGYKYKGEYFPEDGEELLKTEHKAWELARNFAEASPNAINVYVVDNKFKPVNGYKEKMLNTK